jgi:hypothetical protein
MYSETTPVNGTGVDMSKKVRILAGSRALRQIREEGLHPEQIRFVAGAAGGPKWFVLAALDCFLFGEWLPRSNGVVHLVGASIGAWRFAAACRHEPVAALRALLAAYVGQTFAGNATPADISAEGEVMMQAALGEYGHEEALAHPRYRLALLVNRGRGLISSKRRGALLLGLAFAALGNAVNRRALGFFFERHVFIDPRNPPACLKRLNDFPTAIHELSPDNFKAALMASGSIPWVMEPVRAIPGFPPSSWWDGGIIDYHLDLPLLAPVEDGLVLFPHFSERLIPGWFDKRLRRRNRSATMERAVLVVPHPEFTASLPYGKISDRMDFAAFAGRDAERRAYWQAVADAGRALADDFADLVDSGRIRHLVQPLVLSSFR